MKKILITLYIIIFLLISSINVISIKKYFDMRKSERLDDLVATNFITTLVSFNELEPVEQVLVSKKQQTITIEKENEIEEPIVFEEEKEEEIVDEPQEEVVSEDVFIEKEEVAINETLTDTTILYDGLTEQDLILKLEKSLKNELSGTGINFVNYYKTTGLDPYLAVAIVLHETGCTWTCSSLVRECYNYGGMKGGEQTYKDTRYTCYSSKEEGINAYLNMLYNNYYSKGLITAELINPKYATSLEWAVKINNYIEKIKNN